MKIRMWNGRMLKRNSVQLPDPAKFFMFRILTGSVVEVTRVGNPGEPTWVTVVESPLFKPGITLDIPDEYLTDTYFEDAPSC